MAKELIILGHPNAQSYCNEIAETYYKTAVSAGRDIAMVKLYELTFSPNLSDGYHKRTELEPDLLRCQKLIEEAEHIVWVFPIWWATIPALLKGFVDRLFLPGWAFKSGKSFPEKLLKGKTSQLMVTMDSPVWYYKLFTKQPVKYSFARGTLGFCGIKNKSITYFAPIKQSTPKKREAWLKKVEKMAR
ncbi:MAG: NAD(P)H-dependent oxidoreductase [Fibrobacterales bacterium]